jgi:hypothetical protein
LDVANQEGAFTTTEDFPMSRISYAFSITSIIFILAIVPFTIFWYEGMDADDGDDDDRGKK